MQLRIVVLTGAGISAESGLGTFRDAGGLWARYAIEDVATPEAFARDPALVHDFYNMRRAEAARARPNPAHAALARLAASAHEVTLVTQNVDGLHEAAGSPALHMHGRLSGALCAACGHRWAAPEAMSPETPCPACGARAARPDVVWFGEMPHGLEEIEEALAGADLFAAIGTSGEVYPAAGFVEAARPGAHTVELNLAPSLRARAFRERRIGKASVVVPTWVDELLA
ncbi:NAD-dependent deacetylase [Oceanicola granulosus HTCC2516]|uniref:NAD-dependent protein deacylase n=1 Tax=Oceanicola granulosus (strain ATCC BAA-861 / DSM 15982 / KCTC 12143 / HTCC2516) TaxID=314256 RepID=Q2CCR0_OCEGH|nr:NAD-dependent deacylase [Oceanicola granulosus]EAR50453.1 NAD-dependent deacetylase [Oceanicola granulosus HTCC2516]